MLTTETLTESSSPAIVSSRSSGQCLDLLGIGFGPANLSLAIAIEELNAGSDAEVDAQFVEAKPAFGWHGGMLLPGTTMQISFLKDLVALRNPTSSYTFLNYLHERGRLSDFINLKTFFPTRHEFHDYLAWAAGRVTTPVSYGTTADRIDWNGTSFEVTVRASDGTTDTVRARDIVIGAGIRPVLPDGVAVSGRVFHNHELLFRLADVPSHRHRSFLIVGAGQSAAEVAAYLHDTHPDAQIHVSFRRFGYSPSDDTPYANRIFDPASVDEFYTAPSAVKQRLLEYHWQTNYSAVDADLINDLYQREYVETVAGRPRLIVHRVTDVESLVEDADGVTVSLRDLGERSRTTIHTDAVIYATGFEPHDPRTLFGETIDLAAAFPSAEPNVGRDYELLLSGVGGRVFLNGGVQHSHGLTSSLLSNIAIRAQDILQAATHEHPVPRS